jgi:hypothetical protein
MKIFKGIIMVFRNISEECFQKNKNSKLNKKIQKITSV